jgi:hypothetical protein
LLLLLLLRVCSMEEAWRVLCIYIQYNNEFVVFKCCELWIMRTMLWSANENVIRNGQTACDEVLCPELWRKKEIKKKVLLCGLWLYIIGRDYRV